MKLIISIILMLSAHALVCGQITLRYNGIRPGDEIIKQQVDYKDPGREGENVIWDFSKLKSINDGYRLVYKKPYLLNDSTYKMGKDLFKVKEVDPSSLVLAIEHNTMYYFKQNENKLEILGHENPTTLLHYTTPMIASVYPTDYGQSYTSQYKSQGLYSKRIPFESQGSLNITADAFGMIILPSGDTLEHIIRTKTVQIIHEVVKSKKPQNFNIVSETYKWYAKGYRYPVFESIKTYHQEDSLQAKAFKTSFFFPPGEHLYLDDDKENLAVLDSLWNIKHPLQPETGSSDTEIAGNFSYNFYPNPVESQLTIEYYLENATTVTISLYAMDGKQLRNITVGKKDKGLHTEYMDFSTLAKGTYILRIEANHQAVSDKIIKK
ncbi:T9SS type A sorting domain-containing protein [Dysgonomonas sp. HDW5B]|uniref:T9SS type A sorting domain-containing protein n=1 Tax=Dysgonomonas sp. HDW5B TaxID=2714927 RepID=UPI0014079496|nr:T9SS type A sorting domain-containing protein [Dysgonomonas sp. HDW5B]QIK52891.1 T9SS type A sorting domain-containing protein [Dysgonomonas sp. HDW5B]